MRLPSYENVTKNSKETAGTEMNPEVEGEAQKVTPSKYRSVEKELAIQREWRVRPTIHRQGSEQSRQSSRASAMIQRVR